MNSILKKKVCVCVRVCVCIYNAMKHVFGILHKQTYFALHYLLKIYNMISA